MWHNLKLISFLGVDYHDHFIGTTMVRIMMGGSVGTQLHKSVQSRVHLEILWDTVDSEISVKISSFSLPQTKNESSIFFSLMKVMEKNHLFFLSKAINQLKCNCISLLLNKCQYYTLFINEPKSSYKKLFMQQIGRQISESICNLYTIIPKQNMLLIFQKYYTFC